MRLRVDVECLLMDFEYTSNKSISEPYLRNFMTFTEKCSDERTLWDFLWFLNHDMKKYKKYRGIESYQDYLDNKYPPKKKTTRK